MVWETLAQLILPLSVGSSIEALDEFEVASCETRKGTISKGVILVHCWLGIVAYLRALEDTLAEIFHSKRTDLSRLQLDNQSAGLSIDQLDDARARC